MKDKDAFVFIYSVDRADSLEELDHLYLQLSHMYPREMPLRVLVANKVDIEVRMVTTEEGKRWAREHDNMKFFETSAKDNLNVEEIFVTIVKELRVKRRALMENSKNP
mmetsp:Transcript_4566/g.2576  ORF Transcript_4566/g.2576 Transcript_4566/m.2576 type:complete len:108 (+) Transcript_4566:403-726(+)|eukprot:CAMPEP_0201283408 /NCGR_PEP_ID=MMETSP1317-20130820/8466_1 /ASSEMBLY_ACC=CAM_ASM_000770 /TAXON_ID=187299 /ORGANISM="Undescribed Undescribed, Strain Undescribed" /LENGTH=107 /DNA_ID=CAMNT_0047599537 /DNA_START=387 /DNA_END=710 /DNA_ORIENTATION=-